jgi:hypothetical protein
MQGGMPDAEGARDEVVARMSADEIVKAKRMVSEWQPNPAECGLEPMQSAN